MRGIWQRFSERYKYTAVEVLLVLDDMIRPAAQIRCTWNPEHGSTALEPS